MIFLSSSVSLASQPWGLMFTDPMCDYWVFTTSVPTKNSIRFSQPPNSERENLIGLAWDKVLPVSYGQPINHSQRKGPCRQNKPTRHSLWMWGKCLFLKYQGVFQAHIHTLLWHMKVANKDKFNRKWRWFCLLWPCLHEYSMLWEKNQILFGGTLLCGSNLKQP